MTATTTTTTFRQRRIFPNVAIGVSLLSLLLVVALLGATTAQGATSTANTLNGWCSGNRYATFFYEASLQQCLACPTYSSYSASQKACVCSNGYRARFLFNLTMECVPCTEEGMNSSLAQPFVSSISTTGRHGATKCMPCGSALDVLSNETVVADAAVLTATLQKTVTSATYNAALRKCVCPANYILAESFGGRRLPAQVCVACVGSSPTDATRCATCDFPQVLDAATNACVCANGYDAIEGGMCVLHTRIEALFAGISTQDMSITPRNLENEGYNGNPVTSLIVNKFLKLSVVECAGGNMTACNLLANLCVLSQYALDSVPCTMYRRLHALETCKGYACEVPTTLPWLYYLRSSPMIIQNEEIQIKVSLEKKLQFVLSEYHWNGTWLGNILVTREIFLCDIPSASATEFYMTGSNRHFECILNLRWFLGAPRTSFFEMFLMDGNTLRDVPVLTDFSSEDIDPKNVIDPIVFRGSAGADLTPNANGYRRRFYFYDNIGGVPSGNVETDRTQYVTVARRIQLIISLQPTHKSNVFTPLLVIQYSSILSKDMYAHTNFNLRELYQLKTNSSEGYATIGAQTKVKFTMDTAELDRSLMITLIVFCCAAFLSAWMRTYGWMRRQQDLMMGWESAVRFFVYLCNHLSNMFLITVIITCAYIYLFYKYQSSVEYALPDRVVYIWAMLYTATACKGVVVIYRLIEQCNADIFVIDWERPKTKPPLPESGGGGEGDAGAVGGDAGQQQAQAEALLHNNTAVSMWRSTFIANEFNELQTLRGWHPLVSMVLIMLFLEGLQYINLSASVPWTTRTSSATSYSHPLLRLCIESFFFIIVCVVLHFLEYYLYFKFLTVHPLRGFVDLCSVSNISIVILLEPQWGFYIHGRSIHPHSDVSMEEFQANLELEAKGNLPARGLGGQDQCQTFEVFIGTYLRRYLYLCYAELYNENQKALGGAVGPVHAGHHRKCFDFIRGDPGKTRCMTPETMAIKHRINGAFTNSVLGAEKTLMSKFGMHSMLDFPPNIMYMNGAFSGENAGKDLFFLDDSESYGRSLMYGLDFDLFLFYMMLFLSIDSSMQNTYLSIIITFVVDIFLEWYRSREGQANVGAKTLFDDRFFL